MLYANEVVKEERHGGTKGRRHEGEEGPRHSWYVAGKVVVEWVISVVLMMIALPVILALAGIVKLTSDGPAFYTQTRLGRGGRPFRMFKIRSMMHNCEAKTGAVWAKPDDARVTRIGWFMRQTHLDELPQLLNVLRGEMSLVGPRPERPELVSKIERIMPRYRARLRVRPGLTGLAQVRLPADTDLEGVARKLAHDLYYVREVSILLDTRVAVSTALHLTGLLCTSLGHVLVKSHGLAAENETIERVEEAS